MSLQTENDAARGNRVHSLSLAVLAMLLLAFFTHRTILSQNDLSRFVAVESLVRHGTLCLDPSSVALNLVERDSHTNYLVIDLVRYKGRFYSSKPPVLTLVLAGIAKMLELAGVQFGLTGAPVFLLTWVVIGGASAWGFYAFRRKAGEIIPPLEADLATVLSLGGTLFLTYSVTMNHHTLPAAAILTVFFLLGMAEAKPTVSQGRAAAAGLLMSLTTMIDCGPGFAFSVAFGIYLLLYIHSWRAALWYAMGGLPPLALHCAIQYPTFGTVLPVQFLHGVRDYPYSYWASKLGPDAWAIPRSHYWLLTLFSMRGLFVLSPVLLVGAACLARDIVAPRSASGATAPTGTPWLRARGPEAGPAYVALTVLFGIVFLFWYCAFWAPTNFGGACYGFRYYIGFMPLLAFYAARGYARWRKRRWFRPAFYVLGLISVQYAVTGWQNPWMLMENCTYPAVRMLLPLRGF